MVRGGGWCLWVVLGSILDSFDHSELQPDLWTHVLRLTTTQEITVDTYQYAYTQSRIHTGVCRMQLTCRLQCVHL